MDKFFLQRVLASIVLLIITVVAMWFLIIKIDINNKPDLPVGNIRPITVNPAEFPDYDSLKFLTPLELIKEKSSNAKNKTDPEFTKYLEVRGEFSRIYLYAEASVNDKPLTDWDSLYVKFNNEPPTLDNFKAGGHLFRPKSLKVPGDNKTTRLLFNLSVVPYLPTIPYSESRIPITVNWFENVFNFNSNPNSVRKIRFDTFISTTEKGELHLIALYYKCADETPNCYITKVQQ